MTPEEILRLRHRHLGRNLSVAYRQPLKIVRGRGQFLYDEDGRAYLDCVNNVCHVGHCHPRVVAAAREQMAELNTNTRYLHDRIALYAERLAGLLPDPLEVCFFVCSGSEANELALRLARTHTGRRGAVVLDGAYHGHTSALIDLSPYKHDRKGGGGAPSWVEVAPAPDPYRGPHRGATAETGALYAVEVGRAAEKLAAAGEPPAVFFAEPLLGCGGQVVPPPGFLPAAFDAARAAGAVAVADEVQVGFGRVGTHLWAFEALGAVPDVVTLGKPIGNGHPMAAVVTTREIADSFDNGMEYFNTFGGNPVSCAVGMAVLDVIEDEGLMENARRVGEHLLAGLRELAEHHALISDVRGLGLYLGAELVRDLETLEPGTEEATRIVNLARQEGVLLSTDGPHENVLKIKPPIVFTEADADRVVETLDRAFGQL